MPDANEWISVDEALPPPGVYRVQVERDGELIETKKKLMGSGNAFAWFGGCRPFSDNDVVLFWCRES